MPLEAGIGPDNPPCPVCGEPLFGWASAPQGSEPVRRCEECGLAVAGAEARPEEARAAARSLAGGRLPNRRSLQAWIGGSGWAALEPGVRFLFTPESLRRLGLRARARPGVGSMWQTLLNGFTFGHNVALGRLGKVRATQAGEPWKRRLDLTISILATPLAFPAAVIGELAAAICGRGGRLSIR